MSYLPAKTYQEYTRRADRLGNMAAARVLLAGSRHVRGFIIPDPDMVQGINLLLEAGEIHWGPQGTLNWDQITPEKH